MPYFQIALPGGRYSRKNSATPVMLTARPINSLGRMRFLLTSTSVESKRRTKRGLQYEKAVFPRQAYGLGVTAPDATGKMVFTFDKVSLTRGQVFRIYFYERGGARNFVLTLGMNDVNKAKQLN